MVVTWQYRLVAGIVEIRSGDDESLAYLLAHGYGYGRVVPKSRKILQRIDDDTLDSSRRFSGLDGGSYRSYATYAGMTEFNSIAKGL